MKNIKIGIGVLTTAIFGGLILGAVVFANPNSDKNQKFDNNKEQAYIQNEIINKPEYVQDEILVKFQGDDKPFRVIKVKEGKVEEKVKEYKGKANVAYAEPNYILYAFDAPADAHYADWQWALNDTGQTLDGRITNATSGNDINWEQAWTEFNGDSFSPTIIAILDTGIDARHPDLKNKLVPGRNFTDYGGPKNTKDFYEHGVHVAGIAAAETNNNIGIAGVAFANNIKIMPVKVLGDNGCSDTGSVTDGIYYAADNGAKVINLSLGGTTPSETMKDAVNYAWGKGVLIAAAAGNDGDSTMRYPASFDNVMSVAGTDWEDNNYDKSNYNSAIDISAPAVQVLSTLIYRKGIREYGLGTGTSMACPHIAGLAGLLFAQDSSRTNTEVRAIIEESADELGATGWDKYYGHGRINVYAALTYSACASNDDCEPEEICCSGKCIAPTCSGNSDCDDGNDCTTDTCVHAGTCDASCTNTWKACSLVEPDGCCGPVCTSKTDVDCQIENPCETCFKGRCNGVCTKKDNQETCPDCS